MADKLKSNYFLADMLYKIVKDGVEIKEEEDFTKEKMLYVINSLFDCWNDYVETDYFKDYNFPVGYKLTEEDKKLIQEKRKEAYIKGE